MSVRGWVVAIGLVLPTVVTYGHFVGISSDQSSANPRLLAVYSAGKIIQLLLPVVALLATHPAKRWVSPVAGTGVGVRRRSIVLGLAFGLLVGAAIIGLYHYWLAGTPLFELAVAQVRAKVIEFGCDTPARFVAFSAFLSLAHSLLEEYYWRWFAFGGLRRTWPFWPAALMASLAFTGHHVVVLSVYFPGAFWGAVLPFSVGIAAGGVVWCWLYEGSGSLVGPWLSHVLIDAAIMAVGYRMLFQAS